MLSAEGWMLHRWERLKRLVLCLLRLAGRVREGEARQQGLTKRLGASRWVPGDRRQHWLELRLVLVHLFFLHLLKLYVISPRLVDRRVRDDLGQAAGLLDDVIGVSDAREFIQVNLVRKILQPWAGWDELDHVLPVFPD